MGDGRLAGKVAVVTGGTSGLGRAGAIRFAREGANVAVASRREEEGRRVVDEISSAGGEALFFRTDVRVSQDVEALVAQAEDRFGKIDVLYASAGVMLTGTAPETTDEVYEQVLDVNVGGSFRLAKYGIPALVRAGGGSIVLTASELGLVGAREAVAYCASKGAVVNMTRAPAVDCGELGIRVNCLCPGPIDTPMLRDWFEAGEDPAELERRQTEPVLLKRVGEPEEIAETALFLASDASSFMTGAVIVADGGATAWYGL
jgi:meso-butanediol dehydrogenase / (S,S)-butanediol dehydrogenase / diacetyl reductase